MKFRHSVKISARMFTFLSLFQKPEHRRNFTKIRSVFIELLHARGRGTQTRWIKTDGQPATQHGKMQSRLSYQTHRLRKKPDFQNFPFMKYEKSEG